MIRTGNERTGNRLLDIPVKGGEELTEATMAVINAEGYAETATAAAGLLIAGCVQSYCDNRNHIITHRELLTTAVSTTGNSNAGAGYTGYASAWEWQDCQLRLMSEIQIYGSTVFSSSFYDTGNANIQFPLFRLAPNLKVAGLGHNGSRMWTWLSAVVSAAAFANCGRSGISGNGDAAGEGGVRPYFCIG